MTLLRDKEKRTTMRAELYARLNADGVPLAETVKLLRKVLAKDQSAFSQDVGVSLATLRKLEQQGSGVTLASVQKILQRFRLELVVRTSKRGK